MADEKTEQPTQKRLRDAREKGEVAKSQDVPSALCVLAVAICLLVMGRTVFQDLLAMTDTALILSGRPFSEAFPQVMAVVRHTGLSLLLPVLALVMAVALLACLAQVGVLFTFEKMRPRLENLSPGQWFRRVFSLKNAFELLKNILKVGVLGYAAWDTFTGSMPDLFRLPDSSIPQLCGLLGSVICRLILTVACLFTVLAACDYLFQRWQFHKGQMMSRDEVRREFRESEGDPVIRNRRRQLHQELLRQNTLARVRTARVLIVNPTHYAVALDYEEGRTPLPVVVCKGSGELALRMMEIARQENIPIMRNVDLARRLYAEGTEDACIPRDLIPAVAEVLRWALDL